MSQINTELGRQSNLQIALNSAEDNGYAIINQCSPSRPFPSSPASMSEWYGYNHAASCGGLTMFYVSVYYYATPQKNFVAKIQQSCGGAMVPAASNPGNIQVNIRYRVQEPGNGTIVFNITGQIIIPQGQNESAPFIFPSEYQSYEPLSWTIDSNYIDQGNVQLFNCMPTYTAQSVYLLASISLPSFSVQWSSRNSCGGSLLQSPETITINYRLLRYFSNGSPPQETSYQSIINTGGYLATPVTSPAETNGINILVDSYYINNNVAQLYMCN
jgi:hypothetical protein